MAMAMENDKTLCDICNEEKLTHLCEGCSKKFCWMDLTEHHQMLTNELRQIDIDYGKFEQRINEKRQNSTKSTRL
ncbi:unnamed protein product [Adineta steineri]|uniref:Uncharacterized protein n=1 Tax=Adineta steineri TaxID=433720 RepID=A0A814V9C6_9BILA|nr:unnamed protein product [Adineta steineri]